MRYLATLSLLILLAAVPAFAAESAVPFPSAVNPLSGAVTLVEAQGQFFTDLGNVDQVPRGEMITVYHNGIAIAQAQIVKVDRLDSVAQLAKAYRSLILEPGDQVVVQTNLSGNAPEGSPNVVASPKHMPFWRLLPEIEPNMGFPLL